MSFKQLENHSQLLCGRDSEKWKTPALPIWRLELLTNKIKQNYLKQRDPLSGNNSALSQSNDRNFSGSSII